MLEKEGRVKGMYNGTLQLFCKSEIISEYKEKRHIFVLFLIKCEDVNFINWEENITVSSTQYNKS